MSDRDGFFSDLTASVLGLAGEYVQSGGLRFSVKTNLAPELSIGGTGGGGGLADLLGIKAAVIIRNKDGAIVQTIGEPPAIDPLRAGLLLAVLGVVGFVVIRGVLK